MRVTARLLRRHIRRGTEQPSRARDLNAIKQLREAEVEHLQGDFFLASLRGILMRQQQVFRLQVAVNNASSVRHRQRVTQLRHDGHRLHRGQRTTL